MPRNLLLNYLDEVRRQREFLLTRWQLASPGHLEKVDSYAHNGMLHDYAYRLPWLRVPDKDNIQHYAESDQIEADLQELTHHVKDLEDFKVVKTSVVHIVGNDGEVTEVVPSSNPDSPPMDKELVAEMCRKHAMENFLSEWSTMKEEEQFPPALMEVNIFQEALSRLPRLETLCERLKPKPVPDPLDRNDEDIIRRELKYDSGSTEKETCKEDDVINPEEFQKMSLKPTEDIPLLEEPAIIREKDENQNPCDLLQCEDINDQTITAVQDFLNSPVDKDDNSIEEFTTDAKPREPLWQLNSEGLRERKKVTETFLSESVIVEEGGNILEEMGVASVIGTIELDKEKDLHSEEIKHIISPDEEQKMSTAVWKKEKQYVKFPSLLLQELPADTTRDQESTPPNQVKTIESMKLKSLKATMSSQLHWNPVEATIGQMMKVSGRTERYVSQDGMEEKAHGEMGLKEDQGKMDLEPFITWDNSDEQLHCEDKGKLDDLGEKSSDNKSGRKKENAEKYPSADQDHEQRSDNKDQELIASSELDSVHSVQTKTDSSLALMNEMSNIQKETGNPIVAETDAAMLRDYPNSSDGNIDALKERIKEKVDSLISKEKPKEKQGQVDRSCNPVGLKERKKDKVKVNPLDDFLMLRTVQVKKEGASPPKKVSKISKNMPQTDKSGAKPKLNANQDKTAKQTEDGTSSKIAVKKSKNKLVDVILTEPFLDIIGAVDKVSLPVLNQLRSMGVISASYALSSLTPDITRFLLKQHEKMHDTNRSEDKRDSKLCYLVQFHALITAMDLITHCDVTTAILHLSAVQEKYADILQGCLDNIRQTLYDKQCHLHKDNIHHPKILTAIRQITDWFKRKLNKNNGDHDPKILVIIRREARRLVEIVKEALAKVPGLNTSHSQLSQVSYDIVSKQLDSCNCLVLTACQIGQDFPWALFSLVLEYEYTEESPWLELCLRQRIRHIALRTVSSRTNVDKQGYTAKDNQEADIGSQSQGKALKLIASQDVITNSQLLQLLESKHNIMLLERNYSKILKECDTIQLYTADLIIDERTGIILQEMHQLVEPQSVEPLVNRITKLSLQFSECWLILYQDKSKNAGYPLGGQAVNNLSRLHAALVQFSVKTDGFEAKVLHADSLTTVAQYIHNIADQASKTTKNWDKTDWNMRPWLTNTVSKHEKVLLHFPCLNAFSAQVMLTAAPLRELLSMSILQLSETCPWIQQRHLLMFHSLSHGSSFSKIIQKAAIKLGNPRSKQLKSIMSKDETMGVLTTHEKQDSRHQEQPLRQNASSIHQRPSIQDQSYRYHDQFLEKNSSVQQAPIQDHGRNRYQEQPLQRNSSAQVQSHSSSRYQDQPLQRNSSETSIQMHSSSKYHDQPQQGNVSEKQFSMSGRMGGEIGRGCKKNTEDGQQSVASGRVKQEQTKDGYGEIGGIAGHHNTHQDTHKRQYEDVMNDPRRLYAPTHMDVPNKSIQEQMGYLNIPKRAYQDIPPQLDIPKRHHEMLYMESIIKKIKQEPGVATSNIDKQNSKHSQSSLYNPSANEMSSERLSSQPSYHDNRQPALGMANYQPMPHGYSDHMQPSRHDQQRSVPHQSYQAMPFSDMGPSAYFGRNSDRQSAHLREYSMNPMHQVLYDESQQSMRCSRFDPSLDPVRHQYQQQKVPELDSRQDHSNISRQPGDWNFTAHGTTSGNKEFGYQPQDQSVPSSAEREYSFLDRHQGDFGFAEQYDVDNQQVALTPSKNKRLTYERIPGAKGGQTRLVFY